MAAAGEGKWDKKGRRAVKELAATIADRARTVAPVTTAGCATTVARPVMNVPRAKIA